MPTEGDRLALLSLLRAGAIAVTFETSHYRPPGRVPGGMPLPRRGRGL
jgi:hypothetical protein